MTDQKSHLWINITSGFSQSLSRQTGLEELWQRILHEFDDLAGVRILPPSEWHRDFDPLAAFIKRNSTYDARIIDIAYSWGGGYGHPRFARALANRGLDIAHAVLCDPVFRHTWLPASGTALAFLNPFNLAALNKNRIIEIPRNVREVTWFRQHVSTPNGHNLKAESVQTTLIHSPEVLSRPHVAMDDAPEFHTAALHAIGTIALQGRRPI